MVSPRDGFIVFDQFQRYRKIEQLVKILGDPPQRLLEVGAFSSPIKVLLPNSVIIRSDRGREGDIDLRADGCRLPFPDRTFNMVVACDVLEHVHADARQAFLSETFRVCSGFLILCFPQKSELNDDADRTLFEFIKRATGKEYPFLQEHLIEHLPDAQQVESFLATTAAAVLRFGNANVLAWLNMQMAHFLTAERSELGPALALMNDFFNTYFEQSSHNPPTYRAFVIASRRAFSSGIREKVQEIFRVPNEAGETGAEEYARFCSIVATMNELGLRRTERQISRLETVVAEKERQIADLTKRVNEHRKIEETYEGRISEYQATTENLRDYLNLFLRHPAYRIYKFLKNPLAFLRNAGNGNASLQSPEYASFQRLFEPNAEDLKKQVQECRHWEKKPLLNLVTAVFSPPLEIFTETVESVLAQTYDNWIWNIADASPASGVWDYLTELSKREPRIVITRLQKNQGISANTNAALREARGDYIVMLDHDDTLAPHALFSIAQAIRTDPEVDFLYSDSDKLDEHGLRCEPFFKPDWSPEAMLSYNLMNQISVFRRKLLDEVGYLNLELDGAQDWDLYLRISERTSRITHIPGILYHWRKSQASTAQSLYNKPYARSAQQRAITAHLQRTGCLEPEVVFDNQHRIFSKHPLCRWKLKSMPRVSVIIPTRDHAEVLSKCLETLFRLTDYPDYEVLIVDTGSCEQRTEDLYEAMRSNAKFRLFRLDGAFNFSKTCNFGALQASGDLFLFLNNDTEILHGDWMQLMVQWFERNGIGIVGCKLLYPDGTIQHGGVVLGLGGFAAHLFHYSSEDQGTMFGSDSWYRNVSAVTAACMMASRQAFDAVRGFDEAFVLNYSDVDFCIRAREHGFRVLYTPHVRLIHHESASHGRRIPRSDFVRAAQRWHKHLQSGDPYYNPNLSYRMTTPSFRQEADDKSDTVYKILLERMPDKEVISLPDDLA